jgi:hypothetical protein
MPEQIIRSRSGLRAKPLKTDQRVQMRYPCTSDIAVQPLANRKAGVWNPAKVTNISTKGVGLMVTEPIERGTILSVKLEGPGQRFSRPLLLRVVRVAERPSGIWEVGCTFAIPLDEDEISALLRTDNAAQASVRTRPPVDLAEEKKLRATAAKLQSNANILERRCFLRRHLSTDVVLCYGPAFQETLQVIALDGSLGGLKLLSAKPFTRGTILRVRSLQPSSTDGTADICVKYCRAQQTMWTLGVQFVQPPPSSLLLSLGCVEAPET